MSINLCQNLSNKRCCTSNNEKNPKIYFSEDQTRHPKKITNKNNIKTNLSMVKLLIQYRFIIRTSFSFVYLVLKSNKITYNRA